MNNIDQKGLEIFYEGSCIGGVLTVVVLCVCLSVTTLVDT